jgi:osmotically inducible protein OsmC
MGDEPGTNPVELIAAALAGCYSMALNAALEKQRTPATRVNSEAVVHFSKDESGFAIRGIDLNTKVEVSGLDEERFREIAESTKETCPISKALAAVQITLHAELVQASAAETSR